MKIATILGTRPEIIRLSLIIRELDRLAGRHVLIHTEQNQDYRLNDVFFRELVLRDPDYALGLRSDSLGHFLGDLYRKLEPILIAEKPDKVLVLGDTNSALSALLVERMGIPVIHMEAGNRSFDRSMPEELNRLVIDAVASINLPYTERARENLLAEGMAIDRVLVFGNPIGEVLQGYAPQIKQSRILQALGLSSKQYFLATVHRAENVDHPDRLASILYSFNRIAEQHNRRVIVSIHPRTRSRLVSIGDISFHPLVELHEPFGFFDFVKLEAEACCVLTDSGTVQEECCLLQVPAVTMRTSTERPETVECGSNIVAGVETDRIVEAVAAAIAFPSHWKPPESYLEKDVSRKVVKFILGGR